MNRLRLLAFTLAIALFISSVALGQSVVKSPVASDEEIHRILTERVGNRDDRVGVVVGVIEPAGRRIVAHGSLDKNDKRSLNGDTVFEIGSITKVFTSLLLADMVQRGKVALTDPVAKYLPSDVRMPERGGHAITREGDQLYVQLTGQPRLEVFSESERQFFYRVVDAQITFEANGQGRATALVLHQGGRDLRATQVVEQQK